MTVARGVYERRIPGTHSKLADGVSANGIPDAIQRRDMLERLAFSCGYGSLANLRLAVRTLRRRHWFTAEKAPSVPVGRVSGADMSSDANRAPV